MQSAIPRQSERRSGMGSVAILAVCQALGMSCMALSITITALVGKGLAPTPALATLPLSLQFVAAAAMTLPASLLMGRFGRRAGFTLRDRKGVVSGKGVPVRGTPGVWRIIKKKT